MSFSESVLPPLYAKWMNALLRDPIPPERNATCDACAMCAPADPSAPQLGMFFSPVTRCCTFLPELPNFLVGGILGDQEEDLAEGKKSVEERIKAGAEVTPLGLGRPRAYSLIYDNTPNAFGQSKALHCPHHLADGRCGVWRHRESTCSTWFCKYERGRTGEEFWQRLHSLLIAVEVLVSRYAVLRVGLSSRALEILYPSALGVVPQFKPDPIDAGSDPRRYRACWGDFADREAEFYLRTRDIVDALGWDEVMAIGGAELELRAKLVRAAFDRLVSEDVPERPRQRRLTVLQMSADAVYVETYSKNDPLRIPAALFRALPCFDGRPTADALGVIETEHGLRLRPSVVRKLVDFDLLADEAAGK